MMKTKIQLLVLGALLLAGCGGKEEKEEARELLEAFLKVEFEDANIESDDYQK